MELDRVLSQLHLLIEREKYGEALQRAAEALGEYPESAELYQVIATVHYHEDRYEKALEAIEQAIGLDADNSWCFFRKAQIHLQQNQNHQALTAINEAIELDPNVAESHCLQALVFHELKRPSLAKTAVTNGLEQEGNNLFCQNVKAIIGMQKGNTTEILNDLKHALQEDPENELTHANLGQTYLRQSNIRKAKEHFGIALQNDPNNEYARAGMLQAIRASNLPYRLLFRFAIWSQKFSTINRWVRIIGLLVIIQLLPFLIPLYLLFLLWSWFTPPLTDALVVFDKHGKYLMTNPERKRALGMAALCGISVLCLTGWLTLELPLAVLAAGSFLSIVPLHRFDEDDKLASRLLNSITPLLLIGYGISALFFPALTILFTITLIVTAVVYTWAVAVFD